jgi:hypothetical protein
LNVAERAYLTASIEQEEHDAMEREAQRQRELEVARELAETQSRAARQLRRRAVYLLGVLVLAVIAALTAGIFANRNSTLAAQNAESASIANTQRSIAEAEADGRATQQAIAEGEALARATQQAIAEEERAKAEAEVQARATAESIALHERDLAQAQRLAAEANGMMLSNGDPNLIALLAMVNTWQLAARIRPPAFGILPPVSLSRPSGIQARSTRWPSRQTVNISLLHVRMPLPGCGILPAVTPFRSSLAIPYRLVR